MNPVFDLELVDRAHERIETHAVIESPLQCQWLTPGLALARFTVEQAVQCGAAITRRGSFSYNNFGSPGAVLLRGNVPGFGVRTARPSITISEPLAVEALVAASRSGQATKAVDVM